MQRGSETAVSTADATLQSAQEAVSEAASAVSPSGGPPPNSLAFVNKGGRAVVEPFVGSSSFSEASTLAPEPTTSTSGLSAPTTPAPALSENLASSPPDSLADLPQVRHLK